MIPIVLWADLQCPYCLTGETNIQHAIQELGLEDEIQMDIKTFEIHNPEDGDGEEPMLKIFMHDHNMTEEEARAQIEEINAMARDEAGLDIHFEDVHESDDLDAHRLYKYACDHGKGQEMRTLLHHLYFHDLKRLNDRPALLKAAREAGLDPEDVARMLDSSAYIREIRNDEMEFEALGFESVPCLIVGTEVIDHHPTKEEMIEVLKRHQA